VAAATQVVRDSTTSAVRDSTRAVEGAEADSAVQVPFITRLPLTTARPALRPPRAIPDVHGLSLRDAVRSLHLAGFRVLLIPGAAGTTHPAAGSIALPGALVQLGGAP
jgi:hypothetical protein